MGRPSGDPFILTIVFAWCGNVPLIRLAVLSKNPSSLLELENFQDPPLTSIRGVDAINRMCKINGFYAGDLCSLAHSLCIQLAWKWVHSVRK